MFCPNCGEKLEDGSAFCGVCGFNLQRHSFGVNGNSPKFQQIKQQNYINQPNQIVQQVSFDQTNFMPKSNAMSHQLDVSFVDHFFKRTGRINRLRYFKRVLLLSVLELLLFEINPYLGYITIYPTYCLNVRRLQDLNKGPEIAYGIVAITILSLVMSIIEVGFMALVTLLVDISLSLYLLFAAGTVGANKYGADPLEDE